jgi:nickel superoxide dismutase
MDPAEGEKLVGLVDDIAAIFWKTDKAKDMGVYPPS